MNVCVVGAGGLGREMAVLVRQCGIAGPHDQVGFVDRSGLDDAAIAALPLHGELLGDDEWLANPEHGNRSVILGVGDARTRLALGRRLVDLRHLTMPALVHPSAVCDPATVIIGEGTALAAGVVATADINLGRFGFVAPGVLIGHDVLLGDGVVLLPGSVISGNVTIGEGSTIGAGATVLQGRNIGDGATVGAGAVVTTDIAPGATVVGVPARPLGL